MYYQNRIENSNNSPFSLHKNPSIENIYNHHSTKSEPRTTNKVRLRQYTTEQS